jgi:hypothetical protein
MGLWDRAQKVKRNKARRNHLKDIRYSSSTIGRALQMGIFKTNNFLMTSSDDFVHLWEVTEDVDPDGIRRSESVKLVEVISIRFTCLDDFGYGVSATSVTKDGLDLDGKENQAE